MILGKKISDEEMRRLYIDEDMSALEISKILNCANSSVCRRLNQMGIIKPATGHEGRNGKRGVVFLKGYPVVYMPDHPRAKSNGYVKEHILVMEEKLGRSLLPGEVVHHINENKLDNSPENLMLFPSQAAHMEFHWQLRHQQGKESVHCIAI